MTMRRGARRRSRSGTRGPARKTFWDTNATPVATVASGTSSSLDMLASIADREALRRATVKRLLLNVEMRVAAANVGFSFGLGVFVIEKNNIPGGTPVIGADQANWLMQYEGEFDSADINEIFLKEFDLRAARNLRGSDLTLGLKFTSIAGAFNVSAGWRTLLAYG